MMPVSAWLGAVWPRAGCRVTPIKLSCDPPGDDDETGAIIGCWGHRAGSVTVSGDRWLGGDRLHLDSGGDILPDTEHRPGHQQTLSRAPVPGPEPCYPTLETLKLLTDCD